MSIRSSVPSYISPPRLREDPTLKLFSEGFQHKEGQDHAKFATMVQRRYKAVLLCAAFVIGDFALFSDKNLHAFRVLTTNLLGPKGASRS
jgi:hypothetical protein